MGRTPAWSEEEDALLRQTKGVSANSVNERLVAMGCQPRSANQIKQRRAYLERRSELDEVRSAPVDGEQRLVAAIRKRRQLEEERAKVEQLLVETTQLIKELAPDYLDSLS